MDLPEQTSPPCGWWRRRGGGERERESCHLTHKLAPPEKHKLARCVPQTLVIVAPGQLPTAGPENHKLALSAERKDNVALGATPSAAEAVGINCVCKCTDQSSGVHHPEVANPGREEETVREGIGPQYRPLRGAAVPASVAEEWTFRVSRLARHAPGGNGPGPCLRASAHEHYYRLGSLPVESDDFLASNHLKLFKLFCGVP